RRADIPEKEWPRLLEALRNDPLAKPDAIAKFAHDAHELASKWQDLSKFAQKAEANEALLGHARTEFAKDVEHQLVDHLVKGGMNEADALLMVGNPVELRQHMNTDARVKEFFAHNPEKAQVVNRLADGVETQRAFNHVLETRTADLQHMMDNF